MPRRGSAREPTNTFLMTSKETNADTSQTLFPHPICDCAHGTRPAACGISTTSPLRTDFPSVHRPIDLSSPPDRRIGRESVSGVNQGASCAERFLSEQFVSRSGKPFLYSTRLRGAEAAAADDPLFLLYADGSDAA